MPWKVERGHGCQPSKPWAVFKVNADGSAGDVVPGGCHVTKQGADAHQRALYANEPGAGSGKDERMSNLVMPWEWKAVQGSAAGELDGYGVFFNNVDLGDDVALPGSCRKTLADRESSGIPWPLIADHELNTAGMIGSVSKAHEDGQGVRARARFASTQKAQDIRTLALEGHPLGMSITYEALQHYPGQKDGRAVRFLKELRLHEFTVTPFPMNPKARVLAVKAVSDKPWAQFTQADYTPAQWAAACLIDTGVGAADSKGRYRLPVREPSGALNRAGVHAAAGGHGVGAVSGVSAEVKAAAARKLVALYRSDLGEDPPESLLRMAGMQHASLSLDEFTAAVLLAADLPPVARKTAIDLLVGAYADEPAAGHPAGPPTADDGPPLAGAPGGEPPQALAGHIAALETQRARSQWDRLEAEIRDMRGGQE